MHCFIIERLRYDYRAMIHMNVRKCWRNSSTSFIYIYTYYVCITYVHVHVCVCERGRVCVCVCNGTMLKNRNLI